MFGDFFAHHLAFILGLFCHVQQQAGDAAINVHQRQTFNLAIRQAQAFGEFAQQPPGKFAAIVQQAAEIAARHDDQRGRIDRYHRSRTRLFVKHAHLAEKLALPDHAQNDFAAIFVIDHHLGVAGEHEIDAIARVIAGNHNGLPALDLPHGSDTGKTFQHIIVQPLEQRKCADGSNGYNG